MVCTDYFDNAFYSPIPSVCIHIPTLIPAFSSLVSNLNTTFSLTSPLSRQMGTATHGHTAVHSIASSSTSSSNLVSSMSNPHRNSLKSSSNNVRWPVNLNQLAAISLDDDSDLDRSLTDGGCYFAHVSPSTFFLHFPHKHTRKHTQMFSSALGCHLSIPCLLTTYVYVCMHHLLHILAKHVVSSQDIGSVKLLRMLKDSDDESSSAIVSSDSRLRRYRHQYYSRFCL